MDTLDRPLVRAELALPGLRRGKVRDVYDLPPAGGVSRLLIVATDRISAYDVVMPTPIPGKGRLLTEISTFWLRFIEARGIVRTHWLSDDAGLVPDSALGDTPGATRREDLAGRCTIARRARVVPVECVVRGYLEGSGWHEYQATGRVCGVPLPRGLRRCDRLPEAIFTPATKEEQGRHDENITFERACGLVGQETMARLRDASLAIFREASEHARGRGILIADTKFEFGLEVAPDGTVLHDRGPMLVDEALTPDSSRFWPLDGYEPGRPQKSFDKQFLREYLEELVAAGRWDKRAPGPTLPTGVVEGTLGKYREARDRLTRG